ncbi:uncharacterized protein PG998_001639 [Apiospora kogelbergensis]|uniref:Uncharacterized protein n=1 Tax=Apiospora kogelbergensis TaxID=1337665 RepID=A0AAW0QSR9_9PEZI
MSQYYVPQYQHYATTSFPQYGTTFATPTHTTGTLYTVPKPQTTYCFRSQQRSYIVPSQAPMFYHPGIRDLLRMPNGKHDNGQLGDLASATRAYGLA